MNLYDYHQKFGRTGLKKLAKCVGSNHLHLYNLAKGIKFPSPDLAIAIHKATDGLVSYEELLPIRHDKVWPKDMFVLTAAWKKKRRDNGAR